MKRNFRVLSNLGFEIEEGTVDVQNNYTLEWFRYHPAHGAASFRFEPALPGLKAYELSFVGVSKLISQGMDPGMSRKSGSKVSLLGFLCPEGNVVTDGLPPDDEAKSGNDFIVTFEDGLSVRISAENAWLEPSHQKQDVSNNASVFLLWHTREGGEDDNDKLLGTFATEAKAKAQIEDYLRLPGFRDYPGGFSVSEYVIGQSHWMSGFG
jgi:homoserine kinase type II